MSDISILDLAKRCGVTLDPGDPLGSFERAMKARGDVDPYHTGDASAGEPVTRRAQEVLAHAKTLPDNPRHLEHVMTRAPQDDTEKALQDFNDSVYLASRVLNRAPQSLKYFRGTLESSPALQKTLTGDGSAGYGTDWVPTGFSGQLWEDMHLQSVVAANLVQVPMTSGEDFTLPYKAGSVTVQLTSQATDISPSDFTTGKITLSPKGMAGGLRFSGELSEDSMVAVMPIVRDDLATALADAGENALLNGDNANPNQDGVTTVTDVRLAWDGLRFLSLANSETYADLGTFSTDNLRALRAKMGKYGVRPADLMWVTGPAGWHKFLNLDEVTTVDKYGPAATILTGELAKFDGIPIIVSGLVPENLNASGVVDTSVTDNTVVHLVNRKCHMWGTRRRITIEDERWVLGDYTLVVAKHRPAYAPAVTPSATYPTAVIGYNVAV